MYRQSRVVVVSLCDDPDLYGIAVFPGHVQRNEQKAGENSARCLRRFRSLQLYGFPAKRGSVL